jgi:hypothetical protein
LSVRPPLNVFTPLNTTEPFPVFIKPAGVNVPPITFCTTPDTIKSSGELPLVFSVKFPPPNSTTLDTVGVVAKLSFTDVIVPPRTIKYPLVTFGVVVPPLLLNVIEFSVFVPDNVNTPPPLIVTLLVPEITPFNPRFIGELFSVMSPFTNSAPTAVFPELPTVNCPWFTTVGPV